jgi:hypothetical protein
MTELTYERTKDHPHIKLRELLHKDPELAWVWHCNIAQANMGAGSLKWKESNEAACRVMMVLFGVDTSTKFRKLLAERAPADTKIAVSLDGSKT